jgi:hypothetical protein
MKKQLDNMSGIDPAFDINVAPRALSISEKRRRKHFFKLYVMAHWRLRHFKDILDFCFNLDSNTGWAYLQRDPDSTSDRAFEGRLMFATMLYMAGGCFKCFLYCRDEVKLVGFRFRIIGAVYSWFQPAAEVPFEYVTTVKSSKCRLLETDEKLVLLAVTKFRAKAAEATLKAA